MRKMRVLVVDDNKEFVGLLREFLEKQDDIEVEAWRITAWKRWSPFRSKPDIVVRHHHAVSDGLSSSDWPRRMRQRPKIVMLTAFGRNQSLTGS